MALNNTSVIGTVKPLQGNISDDVQQQEENGFRRRQEKRIEDELQQRRIDKEQFRKDKLKEDMLGKIPKNYDTGSSSLNEFQAKLVQQGANRLGEIAEKLTSGNLPESEKIKLQIEAQNIENLPSNLKLSTDNFSQLIKDYKTGTENGSFFKNPEFEKLVLNGFENYVGTLENGLPTVGFVDRNSDGVVDIKDVQTYENLSQGIGTWNFQKQFDLDKMAVETAKGLKPVDNTKVNGLYTIQNKSVPEDEIELIANATLFNNDGTPKESMKSELRKRGLQETPENMSQIKDYYKDRILANTDQVYKESYNYGAENARNRLAFDRSKDAKKDKKTSLGDFSNTSVRREGEAGLTTNVYQYDGKPIQRKVSGAEEQLRSFEIDKNGNLIAVVNVEKPKYTPAQLTKMVQEGKVSPQEAIDMTNESDITTRTYVSNKNNDDVMEFGRQILNPKTRKSAKTAGEIINYLKESGEVDISTPKETPAQRALRIANGG